MIQVPTELKFEGLNHNLFERLSIFVIRRGLLD